MFHHPQLFESIMLLCFGAAWPVSIHKSYKSRSNKGKSLFFLYLIIFGYINGVIFQYMISPHLNAVFIIFSINILLVIIDMFLYYRNRRLAKQCPTPT